MLLKSIYKIGRDKKCLFNFCHAKPELAILYERVGCRRYCDEFNHPYLGKQVSLVLVSEDIDYLKEKHSILLPIAMKYENGDPSKSVRWFYENFR